MSSNNSTEKNTYENEANSGTSQMTQELKQVDASLYETVDTNVANSGYENIKPCKNVQSEKNIYSEVHNDVSKEHLYLEIKQ